MYQSKQTTIRIFESQELKEAERLFEWALSYERKGLKIAADALRDEGEKALQRFLGECHTSMMNTMPSSAKLLKNL